MITRTKEFLKEKRIRRSKDYLVKSSRWLLIELARRNHTETVKVKEIIDLISEGAFYFVMLMFSFPIAIPLPYPPGMPSLCGIPIILLSFQMVLNKKGILLPKFIKEYNIKISLIKMIITKSNKIFKFLSKIIKVDRMKSFTNSYLIPFYGAFFILLSICILIPFPGTNLLPAISIFLFCIGLMFHDGLFVLIAGLIGIIALVVVYFFTIYFAAFSLKMIRAAYEKISSLYFSEAVLAFIVGILIGMVSMFLLTLVFEVTCSKMRKKKKKQSANQ